MRRPLISRETWEMAMFGWLSLLEWRCICFSGFLVFLFFLCFLSRQSFAQGEHFWRQHWKQETQALIDTVF